MLSFFKKVLLGFFFLVMWVPIVAEADTGAKPSIEITLKNMHTSNYVIDLLVYEKKKKNYNSPMNYNGEGLTNRQIETLYQVNYDGWISESTRWDAYLLFADCAGNEYYYHSFSYFGTPDEYKVLIIYDNGKTLLSDKITRNKFNSSITLDVQTMEVVESSSYVQFIFALILTLFIEIILALIMKIKPLKIIVLANIFSNVIFQILLRLGTVQFYIIKFILLELLVFLGEYVIYRKKLENTSKNNILKYTVWANLLSAIFSLVLKI